MSSVKLTLRMNSALIQRAKIYAKKHDKSVSQIVSDYFSLLNQKTESPPSNLPPLTRSLRGVLKGIDISEKDYKKYLEDKYL